MMAKPQSVTVSVPDLNAYTPKSGIGRVFHSLRAEWEDRVRLVPADLLAPALPVLRNFPTGVRMRDRADVVLLPKLTGAQALRDTSGIPGIVLVHDIGIVDFPGDVEGVDWLTRRSVSQSFRGLRYASTIVVVSEFTSRRLAHFLPDVADRIVVIHSGVGATFLEHPHSQAAARASVEYRVGRSLVSPLLIYVGSELPRKNIDLLLRVFKQILFRYPNARLLKVGRAGHARWRERTLRTARDLGLNVGSDILIVEDVDDVALADCYRAADVFVSTSHYEGFGLPALEAMAIGTPVVVCNRGALPEVVGDAGWVVEPTVDAFVEAIADAILGSNERRVVNAKVRASSFTWSRAAKKYLDVFFSVGERTLCVE